MVDWIAEVFIDCFRWLVWLFVRFFLLITDMLYDIFKYVTQINLINNSLIKEMFLLIGVLFALFVIYRIAKVTIKTVAHENYRKNFDFLSTIKGIIIAAMIYAVTPAAYSIATEFTSDMVNNLPQYMDTSVEEMKLSDFIVQGGKLNGDTNLEIEDDDVVEDNTIDYNEIDINEKNDDDKYVYFDDTIGLFFVLILSIALWYILILLSLSYLSRCFSIAIKYIFGAYFIAGLVEEDDTSFKNWTKHLGADMFTNIIQVFALYLVVYLISGDSLINTLSTPPTGLFKYVLQGFIMVAGLLFVLTGPNALAALIGGDGGGLQSVMQGAYQAMTIKSIGKTVTRSLGTAMAGAVYATGRVAGAPSMMNLAQAGHLASPNPFSNDGSGSSSAMAMNHTGYSGSYNDPPTKNQLFAAGLLGVDNAENMCRGDLSKALDKAGASPSYWQKDRSYYQNNGDFSYSNLDASAPSNDDGVQSETPVNETVKPKTKRVAKIMAAASNRNNAAAVAYRSSRLIYEASARRVQSSRLNKPMNQINNTARAMQIIMARNSNKNNGGNL